MRGLLLGLFVGALCLPIGALADPPPGPATSAGVPQPAVVRVPFYPIGSGLIPNTVPASSSVAPAGPSTRNRILIARTKPLARRWLRQLQPDAQAAVRDNYFPQEALLGVFFRRDRAQAVKVTGLWLAGNTLQVALELVPWQVYVCHPPPGGACVVAPISPDVTNPYVVVAVRQAALARVSRVVVTEEIDDAPQVIELVPSFSSCPNGPAAEPPVSCVAATP